MRRLMESCVAGKDPVTVANASAPPRSGGCLASSANATTGSVTNTMDSSAQGTGCATVAAVSAGMAGQGTPARSGWGQSTDEEWTLSLEMGVMAARSDQRKADGHHQAGGK